MPHDNTYKGPERRAHDRSQGIQLRRRRQEWVGVERRRSNLGGFDIARWPNVAAWAHALDIDEATKHYHQRATELYHVLVTNAARRTAARRLLTPSLA